MSFLNNISESAIKAVFAFLILGAITIGFFIKLIDPTVYVGIASTVITHYYNNEQAKQLKNQIDKKDAQLLSAHVEVQSLREAQIVKL